MSILVRALDHLLVADLQTNSLKGEKPRPHMYRSDKQDSRGKLQTWEEIGTGTTYWGTVKVETLL